MDAYERYGRALLRKAERILGNREDARDVVQGLFADLHADRPPDLHAERDRGPGDRSEPGTHDPRGAPLDLPYLYRAVTHRCLTLLRDEANRARLLVRNDEALAPAGRTRCDDTTIGRDLLVKLVRELDEHESELLMYRYLDDMTQEEIAALLGLSRKTIGKRLDRIREVVRRIVAASEESR